MSGKVMYVKFLQMLDEDVKIANWETVEDGFDTWQEIPRDSKIYQLGVVYQ